MILIVWRKKSIIIYLWLCMPKFSSFIIFELYSWFKFLYVGISIKTWLMWSLSLLRSIFKTIVFSFHIFLLHKKTRIFIHCIKLTYAENRNPIHFSWKQKTNRVPANSGTFPTDKLTPVFHQKNSLHIWNILILSKPTNFGSFTTLLISAPV